MQLFAAMTTVIRFWNSSAISCVAALRLTTQLFNWKRSASVIRRIIPVMNAQLLEGHLDETFLHTGCYRADRTIGSCWRLLSQIFHRESAHAVVDARVHCHLFLKMMEIR